MSASSLSRKAATGLLSKPRGLGVGGQGDEGVERSIPYAHGHVGTECAPSCRAYYARSLEPVTKRFPQSFDHRNRG